MESLKQSALRGGVAKIASQGALFVLRIGSLIVLARLLDPTDFGVIGMATVVTGSFNLFRDAGLSMVTVQRADITEEQISTLFWVNMLVGALLALISVALAPVLATFYREPRVFWVAVALGLAFVVNAAGVQHSALLQRRMRFDALAIIEIASWLASVAVGLILAMNGYGYWALAWMAVILPAVSTAGAWLFARWIPGPPRRGVGIRSMLGFGGTVTLNTIIVYVAYNADKLLVGRVWGAQALGIYGRASQLINIPTENLNSAIGGVAVSTLARLQHDQARFKSYFVKSYSLVLALTVPTTIACALLADDMIAVLLGPKWMDAAPIFRLMAPTILAFAIINPLTWMLFATGHVQRSLNMAFLLAPAVIAGYVAGLPYGAQGVAFGYSAAMALLTVPLVVWAVRGSVISVDDVLQAIRPVLMSAVTATVVTFAALRLWGGGLDAFPRLILGGTVLAASYVWMLLYVMGQKPFYEGVIRDSRLALTGLPTAAAG
jgi:O-antigen/teichoic acid export membrane protein